MSHEQRSSHAGSAMAWVRAVESSRLRGIRGPRARHVPEVGQVPARAAVCGGGSGIAVALRGAGFRVRVQFAPRHGWLLISGSDRGLASLVRLNLGAVWVMVVAPRPGPGPVVAMVTWVPADDPDALESVATHDLSPAALLTLVERVRARRRAYEAGEPAAARPLPGSEGLTDDGALWLASGGGCG